MLKTPILLDANAFAISLSSASILDDDDDDVVEEDEDEDEDDDDDDRLRLRELNCLSAPLEGGALAPFVPPTTVITLVTLVKLDVDVDCCGRSGGGAVELDALAARSPLDLTPAAVGLFRNASGVIR